MSSGQGVHSSDLPSAAERKSVATMKRSNSYTLFFAAVCGVVVVGGVARGEPFVPYKPNITAADFKGPVPNPLPTYTKPDGTTGTITGETVYSTRQDPKVGYTTSNGVTTATPTSITISVEIDQGNSWLSPDNPPDIDHEQGHPDIQEQIAREAQAKINELVAKGELKGEGDTDEKALADLQNKVDKVIADIADARQEKYDNETDHGTIPDKQAAHRQKQKEALKPKDAKKKETQLNTRADRTITFNAATKTLSITGDTVQSITSNGPGFVPSPTDPVLGATITLPEFVLSGPPTIDGEFFFPAVGLDPTLSIVSGGNVLFSTGVEYLMYDPALNQFSGFGQDIFFADGVSSPYLDALRAELTSGGLALFASTFIADADFMALTSGFTVDGASAASDVHSSQRIPEPAMLAPLVVAAIATLRRVRRPDRSA